MKKEVTNIWWGPPKKFSSRQENRKISWLELFYDLVYVIAISAITHAFHEKLNFEGFLNYFYMFTLIFWSWFNGSLHHDLHGTRGLRTNLMTLWQMAIIAALVIVLNGPPEKVMQNGTIVVLIMQMFITYLWWSVGYYDQTHRKLNKPFNVCFLISFAIMFSCLFLAQPYVRIAFYISLFFNFLPYFWAEKSLKKYDFDLSMSESMSERLGSFTIIVFGEVVLGLINGFSDLKTLSFGFWINFMLELFIVFSLWWIFFSMIADKKIKQGMKYSNIVAIIYIPTLMSLGVLGISLSELPNQLVSNAFFKYLFCSSICVYLSGIVLLIYMLNYPIEFQYGKIRLRNLLIGGVAILATLTLFCQFFSILELLITVFAILISIIFMIQRYWLKIEMNQNHSSE